LTTSMLGITTVSTPMVVIPTSSDWVTPALACCFWVSTNDVFYIIRGAMLTWDWQCSSLWLPIGIHYGAIRGCENPYGFLFFVFCLNRCTNLSTLWSQLAFEFHASKYVLDYTFF
jgi:hypothetical protein